MTNQPLIIGITGGSGSGKSFFLSQLVKALPFDCAVISQDNYYKSLEQQPLDVQGKPNFDTLESIDFKRFESDVKSLMQGEVLRYKEYTYNNAQDEGGEVLVKPAPVIVIEGIFVFNSMFLYDLMNYRLFIDAPIDLCIERRIKRDLEERGYDKDNVLYQYEYHVIPAYKKLIAPFMQIADKVVDNKDDISKDIYELQQWILNNLSTSSMKL